MALYEQVQLLERKVTELGRRTGSTGTELFDIIKLNPTQTTLNYRKTDTTFLQCDATDAPFTITLPSARDAKPKTFLIKKTDSSSNAITISTVNGETVDGEASKTIDEQYGFAAITTGDTSWHTMSDSDALGKIGNLELYLGYKLGDLNGYKEFTYVSGDLTQIDIYTDNTKTTKEYTKVLSYSGGDLSTLITTRVSDGATFTKTFGYTSGDLTSITLVA